jgi:hypothetical protein
MSKFRVKTSDGDSYITEAHSQNTALRHAEASHPKAERIEVYPAECEKGATGVWSHLKGMSEPVFTPYEILVSDRRRV